MKESTKQKLMWIVNFVSAIVLIILNVRKIILNEKADKREEELHRARMHDLEVEDEIQKYRLERERERSEERVDY